MAGAVLVTTGIGLPDNNHWRGLNDRFAAGERAAMLDLYMRRYERLGAPTERAKGPQRPLHDSAKLHDQIECCDIRGMDGFCSHACPAQRLPAYLVAECSWCN